MISLKKLLCEDLEYSHGWMTPDGNMIPIDTTHFVTACKLVPDWREKHLDPFIVLWKRGYLRVTSLYDRTLVAHNEETRPNEKQIQSLKKIAIKYEYAKIDFDNGKQNVTLWSNIDTI